MITITRFRRAGLPGGGCGIPRSARMRSAWTLTQETEMPSSAATSFWQRPNLTTFSAMTSISSGVSAAQRRFGGLVKRARQCVHWIRWDPARVYPALRARSCWHTTY